MRRVLLKLVRTGEGTKDTRQRRLKTELLDMGMDAKSRQTIESVITALVDGRLLISDRVNNQDVIDLSHEAIIQRWQRLVKWREQDRDLRRLVDRIEDSQRDWIKQGQKRQNLLQGRLLKDARRLLKQRVEGIAGAKEFILKSHHWQRMQFRATLLVPAIVVGLVAEIFLREALVNQDYRQIASSGKGDPGERAAVLDLARGCWAKKPDEEQKPYKLILQYFRERSFGNCRSLDNLDLKDASLFNANLSGASLDFANLSGANLDRLDLSGASLDFANLSGAILLNANLSGASLNGADFKDARFGCVKDPITDKNECTNLANIKWDKNTQWQGIQDRKKAINIPPALQKQWDKSPENRVIK